ncbi:MAG: NAD(P)/FAD-dependent oxidoreductase [Syntrophaceae bacterium]|nr:NAD(P)/FAD-dependent oxidoreductase [Syntrophaceae bacterium]
MEIEPSYEAIVIGSGIGGLSVGILLAGLGLRPLVCEKNALPGGLMRGYRRAGVDWPVGIHYFGSFGEGEPLRRICDLLGVSKAMAVERMGQGGPIDRYLFGDFRFDLPEGLEPFKQSLTEAFPKDRKTIVTLDENLRKMMALLDRFAFLAPESATLEPALFVPLREQLAAWGASTGLRMVLSVAARWMGMDDRECPLFYHHLALASYLCSSWRLRGSGVELAELLAARLQELGGILSCADPVQSILVEGGRVSGVRLASGREFRSRRVITAIHPKRALTMLPAGTVKSRHGLRIEALAETEGLFAMHALVDADRQPPLLYNLFQLHGESPEMMTDGVFYQLRPGPPGKTLLIAMTSSPFTEWSPWEGTVSGRRGPDYAEAKARLGGRLLKGSEQLLGCLGKAEVIDCYTPLTLRDWMDCPQGAPYGIQRSLRQLPMMKAIQMLAPPGLWFSGQNVVSPGLLGTLLGSLQTLRQVIGPERFTGEVYQRLAGS